MHHLKTKRIHPKQYFKPDSIKLAFVSLRNRERIIASKLAVDKQIRLLNSKGLALPAKAIFTDESLQFVQKVGRVV